MLSTSIVKANALSDSDTRVMFHLYNVNYDGADDTTFKRDLSGKDYVIVLRDPQDVIRGFSTLAIYDEVFNDKKVRVLYSGDTIIEKAYWGDNQFAKTWLQFAGKVQDQQPEIPLYWLLIVKGHRTYRYLSLFSSEYFPRHDLQTPQEFGDLMHHLARQKFGNSYDANSGLVRFPEPRSFLNSELAVIADKDIARPEVQYFLKRNPEYARGDELLCLCELKKDKLTRIARQWFQHETSVSA